MNVLPLHRPEEVQAYAWSWAVSLLLHGLAIGAAVVLVSGLSLAPRPEPFRWVVSKIEPRTSAESLSQAQPTTAQPSKPMPAKQARPVEADETPTQPVPPIQQQSTQPAPVAKPAEPAPVIREAITPKGPAPSEPVAAPVAPPTPAPATHSAAAPIVASAPATQAHAAAETQAIHTSPQAQVQVQDIPSPQAPPASVASLMPASQPSPQAQPTQGTQTKSDYGWLGQMLRTRVEQLKHYPHVARANRWEGRVVLRAVIGEDGRLVDLKVAESSGHSILDEAALEVLKKTAPLTLPQPLGRPQVVVQVPISYRLR